MAKKKTTEKKEDPKEEKESPKPEKKKGLPDDYSVFTEWSPEALKFGEENFNVLSWDQLLRVFDMSKEEIEAKAKEKHWYSRRT